MSFALVTYVCGESTRCQLVTPNDSKTAEDVMQMQALGLDEDVYRYHHWDPEFGVKEWYAQKPECIPLPMQMPQSVFDAATNDAFRAAAARVFAAHKCMHPVAQEGRLGCYISHDINKERFRSLINFIRSPTRNLGEALHQSEADYMDAYYKLEDVCDNAYQSAPKIVASLGVFPGGLEMAFEKKDIHAAAAAAAARSAAKERAPGARVPRVVRTGPVYSIVTILLEEIHPEHVLLLYTPMAMRIENIHLAFETVFDE